MIAELWTTFGGRCLLSSLAMAVSGCAFLLWPRGAKRGVQMALLGLIALGARALFMELPVSDDVHRYVWEGQLVLDGISPYATTADDPTHAARRDAQWQQMNHKDALTAYPPLALLLCASIDLLMPHEQGFKLASACADLLIVLLLAAALPVGRLRWAALYALNPVPLISYAGEGHFDAFMVLAMLAAIVFIDRPRVAWAALGSAIGLKFVALLLLPVLWQQTPTTLRRRCLGILAITLLLPALPFIGSLHGLVAGVTAFGTATSGNATLHWLFELLTHSKLVAALLCGATLLAWIAWVQQRVREPIIAARQHLTGLLLCAPTVTYWYVGWALPFAALAPTPALWILSATDILYYVAWQQQQLTGVWWMPRWAWTLMWLPLVIALLQQKRVTGPRSHEP